MIRIEADEEMDFMFRANAKIDGRKVGSGWLYVTDVRVVFESDKHGISVYEKVNQFCAPTIPCRGQI